MRMRGLRNVVSRRALVVALTFACAAFADAVVASAAAQRKHTIWIYAPRVRSQSCTRVLPLKRTVASPGVLTGALRALLAGPTAAERARGYGGWFSQRDVPTTLP